VGRNEIPHRRAKRLLRDSIVVVLLAAAGGCSNRIDEPPPSSHYEPDPPYNERPAAKVTGGCSVAHIGDEILFDGTESSDPDGDPLTYRWEVVAAPVGDVTLIDPTTPTPTFIPHARGNYSFRLIVNDGREDSYDGGGDVKSVTVYSMEPVTTAKKVASGWWHFIVLMQDQTVHGWGCNDHGQAGSGAVVSGAVDVAAGAMNSLAIMSDGTVKAWGRGGLPSFKKEPSDFCGSLACARTPVVVKGLSNIVDVVSGSDVVYALDGEGTVWWPKPAFDEPPPIPVVSGVRSTGIEFAALMDGSIWTPKPLELSKPLTGIVKVSSVYPTSHLALKDDGTVWFIGLYGEVVEEIGLPPIVDIAAGYSSRLALDAQGNVWDLTQGLFAKPVLTDVVDIAAGYHGPAAAVKSDGTVWTWGSSNIGGERGDGTTEPHDEPVQVMW